MTKVTGKVHGSHRDRDHRIPIFDLLVYYEVPAGQDDEVKMKIDDFIRNQVALQYDD